MSTPAAKPLSFTSRDLPAMYQAANQRSRDGQATYLRFVMANLVALVLGSLFTAFQLNPENETLNSAIAIAGSVVLFISCGLTWVIYFQRFEKVWFAGRAVSESVKTWAWRFAVKAIPFADDDATAESKFADCLQKLWEDRKHLGAELTSVEGTGEQITAPMRALRASSLPDRRAVYVRDRIEDQKKWYASKAEANRTAKFRWFTAVIVAQLVAAILAIVAPKWPMLLGWTPVAVAVASAMLAWLQVKQHQELAQAYGIAAHELSLIDMKAKTIQSEQQLSDFVQDAENAISREHTLWVARRDHMN